jgi:hypothetical protein
MILAGVVACVFLALSVAAVMTGNGMTLVLLVPTVVLFVAIFIRRRRDLRSRGPF